MKRYSIEEKSQGELAIRSMSKKAQDGYNNTEARIAKYGAGESTRYAIFTCDGVKENLTFKEAEVYFEEEYDVMFDCENE